MKAMLMLLTCFLMQGCSAVNQYSVDANKTNKFPPSREMKVAVLPLLAPTPGVSKYSTFRGEGTYTTPENAGAVVADMISSALLNITLNRPDHEKMQSGS